MRNQIFEEDVRRVEYGQKYIQVSGKVVSLIQRARSLLSSSINAARDNVHQAYDLVFDYSSSEFAPSNEQVSGLLRHINRVERRMEASA